MEYDTVPGFNFHIPKTCSNVDPQILNPINTWDDKGLFRKESKKLASAFVKNMEKYLDQTPAEVVKFGGPSLSEFDLE